MGIYEKLLAVQTELKAPKSQYNAFGKYKYRSCEDILEAAKPILKNHKAVVFLSDAIKLIGERYYIEASAHFVDVENGDEIIITAYAREEESKKGMDGSQVTGASSSYARKYALNGLFDIDDSEDSDSGNNQDDDKPKKDDKTPREKLIAKLHELNIDVNEYAQRHGLNSKTTNETFIDLLKDLEG